MTEYERKKAELNRRIAQLQKARNEMDRPTGQPIRQHRSRHTSGRSNVASIATMSPLKRAVFKLGILFAGLFGLGFLLELFAG